MKKEILTSYQTIQGLQLIIAYRTTELDTMYQNFHKHTINDIIELQQEIEKYEKQIKHWGNLLLTVAKIKTEKMEMTTV